MDVPNGSEQASGLPAWLGWAVGGGAAGTIALVKDLLGVRTWIAKTRLWKWLTMFIGESKRLRTAESDITGLREQISKLVVAQASQTRKKTIMLHGVLWSASEVQAYSRENVPFCPECAHKGIDTVLDWKRDLVPDPDQDPLRLMRKVEVVNQISVYVVKCSHTAHAPLEFVRNVRLNHWENARASEEIRKATRDSTP